MKLKAIMCAAAVCGGVSAVTAADEAVRSDVLEEGETSVVSATATLAFDSKYLSYGFVDNRDPILTPSAEISFFETLTFGVEAIFDMTKYGRQAGYGNRGGKYTELHPYIGLGHSFSPEDYEWLPTTVELSLSWLYEYHPECKSRHGDADPGADDDTQFWTLGVALPDLWLEPSLSIERDVIRDNGTYASLEIGHSFNLLGDENDTLVLRPSIAQGFGNCERVKAYVGECERPASKNGLMDTLLKLELTWSVCDNLQIGGYVGYADFLFDRDIRRASRSYEATGRWDESWNFIGGLSASLSF